ncbi:MAG: twin-arginine translocase subunit TatC [Planctomycetota bacterium]|jgi:sec-independent protein translocase protein TatC|nr:twin-arginine translocase subunit TatC [Planctomycetota bacterium]
MKGDDLFEKSSMTFGEHLEELRIALVKSSIWLGLGMILGLMLATQVVTYMQGPLEKSLENFYKKKSLREIAETTGTPVPADLEAWMKDNKVVSQYVWIDPRRLSFPPPTAVADPATAVGEAPETAPNDSPIVAQYMADADSEGLPDPSKMIKLRMFVGVKASTEALGLQEPFMIWLKAAFVVAAVVASPGIFYHLWQFISSGLYPHERRYVYFFLPTSLILFWSGACLAFFVIFQLVIDFLLDFNANMGIGASPRLTDYMSFALFLPLGFGVAFQLPLAMLVLERLGIFSYETYLSQWRIAVLAIAFISMILTPADMVSMIGMGVPLVALYFLGIAMCKYLPRAAMQNPTVGEPT